MLWCASIARHCYGLHGCWLSCATAQGGALSSAQFQTVGSTHVELLLQGSRRAAAVAAGCGGADPGAREAVREARQACAAAYPLHAAHFLEPEPEPEPELEPEPEPEPDRPSSCSSSAVAAACRSCVNVVVTFFMAPIEPTIALSREHNLAALQLTIDALERCERSGRPAAQPPNGRRAQLTQSPRSGRLGLDRVPRQPGEGGG
jgi:hypothetical protein